ncbi:type IX secretion system membrane protein PorP/SprF [Apibacter muscae]|uniref:PorP/SprF family type IX secretion system membrane protein n=1 Tax=Apibacter muscae TaxID=2509004 RepID=UPI0011ABB3C2|nr:type IX secretion system membrane protein PorP/SprF [Apibacter muscae]TWP23699.1 type IX secretion system membrane protein PorP/SprF [Apibacter muscae]
MKNFKLLLLFSIFFLNKNFAQQSIPFDQQYLLSDKVLINPSYTGSTDDIVFKATYHQQWNNIESSPNTQTISLHSNIFDRVGLGIYLFRDENGPMLLTGFNLSSAYHIPLGDEDRTKSQFSFGASVSMFSQSFDYSRLRPDDLFDPLIYNNKTVFLPYLNLGMSVYYSGFFAGVSVLDLPLGQNKPVVNSIEPSPSWYYLNLGYDWQLPSNLFIEPSMMFTLNTNAEKMIDFNLRAKYQSEVNLFAVGVSYRIANDSKINGPLSLTPFFQAELNKLNFSFGYNFGLTDIYKEGGNGLLVGLGYNLDNFINSRGFRYR